MTGFRPLRALLILSPVLMLPAAGILYIVKKYNEPIPEYALPTNRLVVVCVFDQLRGDYPARWSPLFGDDGFERMRTDGVWYRSAMLPYAGTTTSAGHASISTGAAPAVHGVVDNQWFERSKAKVVYAATGDRLYERVPRGAAGGRIKDGGGLSPDRLLIPTIGDELIKDKSNRVYSLALKDRAAILLGGKTPNGAYWYDPSQGDFHTSTYYREQLPAWVEAFNASGHRDRWLGGEWTHLRDAKVYPVLSGPDDAAGEVGQRTFPHRLPGADRREDYHAALEATPFGNELLWEFGKACLESEQLGKRDGVDLLFLGFSANDPIGHAYGPNSQEVMDATLRTDVLLGEIIQHLNSVVGPGRYTLIVTADHGVCDLPETERVPKTDGVRFDPNAEYGALNDVLDEKFGKADGQAGRWIERFDFPWITLNAAAMKAGNIPPEVIEDTAAQWAANRPAVAEAAFTRSQLSGGIQKDTMLRSVQLSFHPERSGDVYLLPKPYALPLGKASLGTTHGSPHPYDRHVPIFAYGLDVPNLGEQKAAVNSLILGPILCRVLGIAPTPDLSEKLPSTWNEDASRP